jgi:hypothetical protein
MAPILVTQVSTIIVFHIFTMSKKEDNAIMVKLTSFGHLLVTQVSTMFELSQNHNTIVDHRITLLGKTNAMS